MTVDDPTQAGGAPAFGLLNAPTLEELQELAQPHPDRPAMARRGSLGLCRACRLSVASHWDSAGRWLGCTAAASHTVYVLWPVAGAMPAQAPDDDTPQHTRAFGVARYYPGEQASARLPRLSDHRKRVFQAVQDAGADGTLAREISARTNLPNGSVQQAARWLRDHHLITAVDATQEE